MSDSEIFLLRQINLFFSVETYFYRYFFPKTLKIIKCDKNVKFSCRISKEAYCMVD